MRKKKHYAPGLPVKGSRASVATWSLTVMFRTKEQCRLVINEILKLEFDVNVAYSSAWVDNQTMNYVVIDEMSWANNMTLISKIFDKYDYNSELPK